MAFLATEAMRGKALVDPCCGQGQLLRLAQSMAPTACSVVGRDLRRAAGAENSSKTAGEEHVGLSFEAKIDGNLMKFAEICGISRCFAPNGSISEVQELPLGSGEADVVLSELPDTGEEEDLELLYQTVVEEELQQFDV